jgi:hypothetical protein
MKKAWFLESPQLIHFITPENFHDRLFAVFKNVHKFIRSHPMLMSETKTAIGGIE